MRIAVIGAGISGMGAAYALSRDHDVTLFEQDERFGGHANTVDIDVDGRQLAVDTGFIVFNERNYPNLCGLFEHLGVASKWSDMSFGFSMAGGKLEYACDDLDKIFAQRRNLMSASFLRGMRDVLKFNRIAPERQDRGKLEGLRLGDWMAREGFSPWFSSCFVQPMGGAIWSVPQSRVLDFPAESFVSFFRNHDLMTGLDPAQRWRTVSAGSRDYVERLIARLGPRAVRARAVAVRRAGGRPTITFDDGSEAVFDHVILACHGPQSHALVTDLDAQEREILGSFRTTRNRAVLHLDPALMPRRRKVWSSWNFLSSGDPADRDRPSPVTYWMNRLQGLETETPILVSLNPRTDIRSDHVFAEFDYAHPVMDETSFCAQAQIEAIQGRGGVWYAGAWLGYGFHEDGLKSGLRIAAAFGARPSWAPDMPAPVETPLAEAAE